MKNSKVGNLSKTQHSFQLHVSIQRRSLPAKRYAKIILISEMKLFAAWTFGWILKEFEAKVNHFKGDSSLIKINN